jgi:hypothetical protein
VAASLSQMGEGLHLQASWRGRCRCVDLWVWGCGGVKVGEGDVWVGVVVCVCWCGRECGKGVVGLGMGVSVHNKPSVQFLSQTRFVLRAALQLIDTTDG